MQCDRARGALAHLVVAALTAVAGLGVPAPAARADGDPGSDALVSQDLPSPPARARRRTSRRGWRPPARGRLARASSAG